MATDDEVIKLVMQVQGQDEAVRLRGQIEKLREQIAQLGPSVSANDPKMLALGRRMSDLNAQVADLDKQFGKTGNSRDWGRSVLEGSRALEDLQYGIGGVLNNIPSLVQSLGGPAGLAGAASLVAVGATVLARNWDTLMGAFGSAAPKTAAEQMKELEGVIERTAKQTEKLNVLKRDDAREKKTEAKAGELAVVLPEANQKSAKMVGEAIQKRGTDNRSGFDILADTLKKDISFLDQFIDKAGRARVEAAGKKTWVGDLTPQRTLDHQQKMALEDERAKAEAAMRRELADPAAFGNPAKIKRLQGAVRDNSESLNRDGFDVGRFLTDLQNASPDKIRQAEQAKAMDKFGEELVKAAKKLKEGIEKAAKEKVAAEKKAADETKRVQQKALDDSKKANADELAEYEKQEAWKQKIRERGMPGATEHAREQRASGIARERTQEGRIGQASGLSGQVDDFLIRARQNALANPLKPKVRAWKDMTLEERKAATAAGRAGRNQVINPTMVDQENALGKANDKADEQAKKQVAAMMLRNNLTNSPVQARAAAEMLVNKRREALNEQSGDPQTKALEDNKKSLDKLTEAVVELNRKGPSGPVLRR